MNISMIFYIQINLLKIFFFLSLNYLKQNLYFIIFKFIVAHSNHYPYSKYSKFYITKFSSNKSNH